MNILICINNNFTKPACALLHSICCTNNCPIDFYICYFKLASRNKHKITDSISGFKKSKIHWVKYDRKELKNAVVSYNYPPEIYLRLLAPYKININKALYLDTDIIVKGDLKDLYSKNLENYTFAAAKDPLQDEHIQRLSVHKIKIYFNSGVLLMNFEKFRNLITMDKLLEFINSRAFWWNPDQDLINISFKDKEFLAIEPDIYNYSSLSISDKLINYESIIIIHYAGNLKPWFANGKRLQQCFYDEYWKNAYCCGMHKFPSYWTLGLQYLLKRCFQKIIWNKPKILKANN